MVRLIGAIYTSRVAKLSPHFHLYRMAHVHLIMCSFGIVLQEEMDCLQAHFNIAILLIMFLYYV